MHANFRAALARIHRISDAQARAVDAPFVEGNATRGATDQPRFQLIDLVTAQPHVVLTRLERLIGVVQIEESIDCRERDFRLQRVATEDRHQERDAEQQMRRDALDVPRIQARALGDCRVVGQVARAAMDHAAGVATGTEGNVVAFEERDLEPSQ